VVLPADYNRWQASVGINYCLSKRYTHNKTEKDSIYSKNMAEC
jgi:hypothetical protein